MADDKGMTHMERTEEVPGEGGAKETRQRYPSGLRISLDHEDLEKIGMTELPKVGEEYELICKVTTQGASESEYEGPDGKSAKARSVTLQITHMEVEKAGEDESEEEGNGGLAKRLYPEQE